MPVSRGPKIPKDVIYTLFGAEIFTVAAKLK